MEKRPYSSTRDDSYSRNDSYSSSRNDNNYSSSRNDNNYSSSRNDNNYSSSRNDSSTSSGYSRNDTGNSGGSSYSSSRNDSYSRDEGYKSRGGGYSSRGRGGGGYQTRFGGSQNNGDSWECSSCKFSNYASRSSCYKCRNSKDGGSGDEPRRKWGMSDDSSWKKPSYNDSRNSGSGNSGSGSNYGSRDRSYSSYGKNSSSDNQWKSPSWKNDSWGSKDKSDNSDALIDWDDMAKNGKKYEAERWAHLPEIIKNLYVEHPEVAAMTPEEAKQFREESNELEANSSKPDEIPVPKPVKTFEHAFSNYPLIMAEIKRQGFTIPSPIQCQAWPILMKGYDMIGTSQTGTGKTLAFLLPGLLHIVTQTTPRWERVGPTCLVLAPTRELAQQIEREVSKFEYENIRCVCCYGQGDKRNQVQKLNAMSEIVIATPGRLNDFLEQGVVDLSGVSYLVLDEADRMLDMGFEPQVRKIVMNIRPDRQTILTSATWPEDVRQLAGKLMKDPIHVIVGSLDLKAVDTITQHVIVCSVMEKEDKLMDFLKQMKPEDKAIVFVGQKVTVDHLSGKLYEAGFYVESMHGGRNQRDREHSLRQLKSGRSKILIATDVAARGIDINDITYVLNYDCPKDMEEYVHRVGRTGRAGRKGVSVTLMCRDDWKVAGKLIEILEKSHQTIPPELEQMKRRWDRVKYDKNSFGNRNGHYGGGGGGGGNRGNGWFTP